MIHSKTNTLNTLKTTQQFFKNYIVETDPEITTLTVGNDTLSAEKRLAIYYDGYRLRLLEVLANDFPKLQMLMGADAFDELGYRYIEKYPSSHFSVSHFGQHLPQFLKETTSYAKTPYLSEMAAFEWALGYTLDAADATLKTLEDLQSISADAWVDLTLQFHPSLQIVSFEWNVPLIWKALENKEEKVLPTVLSEPVTFIFWRHHLQNQFRSLSPLQAKLLRLFQANQTFGEICEKLAEDIEPETIPSTTLAFIQQCLMDGCIITAD